MTLTERLKARIAELKGSDDYDEFIRGVICGLEIAIIDDEEEK